MIVTISKSAKTVSGFANDYAENCNLMGQAL